MRVNNNHYYQEENVTSAEISCEHGEVTLSESFRKFELKVLEKDLSELIHIVHITERPTVKRLYRWI